MVEPIEEAISVFMWLAQWHQSRWAAMSMRDILVELGKKVINVRNVPALRMKEKVKEALHLRTGDQEIKSGLRLKAISLNNPKPTNSSTDTP